MYVVKQKQQQLIRQSALRCKDVHIYIYIVRNISKFLFILIFIRHCAQCLATPKKIKIKNEKQERRAVFGYAEIFISFRTISNSGYFYTLRLNKPLKPEKSITMQTTRLPRPLLSRKCQPRRMY